MVCSAQEHNDQRLAAVDAIIGEEPKVLRDKQHGIQGCELFYSSKALISGLVLFVLIGKVTHHANFQL